jgi:hypothetical protein
MARASLIQFSSGSHSSADLQSVHARKHSAFAVALILAFVAKNPSYRIVQAEQTPPFVELCPGKVTAPGEPDRHVLPPLAGCDNRHTASTEALASNDS